MHLRRGGSASDGDACWMPPGVLSKFSWEETSGSWECLCVHPEEMEEEEGSLLRLQPPIN